MIESFLSPADLAGFVSVLQAQEPMGAGTRNLLDDAAVADICRHPSISEAVCRFLGQKAFCVRGILFDKTAETNWALDFHQDTKIAVAERVECDGFGAWSVKEGVVHVRPPVEVLQRQIALRIHLDPCFAANGGVEVIPHSYTRGFVTEREIAGIVSEGARVVCEGAADSALVFHSLLLHGSRKATMPTRRRVLHLEFCDQELHENLQWKWHLSLI